MGTGRTVVNRFLGLDMLAIEAADQAGSFIREGLMDVDSPNAEIPAATWERKMIGPTGQSAALDVSSLRFAIRRNTASTPLTESQPHQDTSLRSCHDRSDECGTEGSGDAQSHQILGRAASFTLGIWLRKGYT